MNDDIDDDPDTDNTERKQSGLIPFKPGQSGNPTGRPKGSRNKLSEEFLSDLLVEWRDQGPAALKKAAAEKPVEFCKMVASLLPKEIAVKNELSEFTDEELAALIALTESIRRDAEDEDQEGTGKGTLQ